jgi:hypothetical protein
MPLLPRFLLLAFIPQLVFWVGFTVLVGSLVGSITALVSGRAAAVTPAPART